MPGRLLYFKKESHEISPDKGCTNLSQIYFGVKYYGIHSVHAVLSSPKGKFDQDAIRKGIRSSTGIKALFGKRIEGFAALLNPDNEDLTILLFYEPTILKMVKNRIYVQPGLCKKLENSDVLTI